MNDNEIFPHPSQTDVDDYLDPSSEDARFYVEALRPIFKEVKVLVDTDGCLIIGVHRGRCKTPYAVIKKASGRIVKVLMELDNARVPIIESFGW